MCRSGHRANGERLGRVACGSASDVKCVVCVLKYEADVTMLTCMQAEMHMSKMICKPSHLVAWPTMLPGAEAHALQCCCGCHGATNILISHWYDGSISGILRVSQEYKTRDSLLLAQLPEILPPY